MFGDEREESGRKELQRMSKPYKSKAWLEEEYIQRRKTVREIAEECGTSPMTISRWLLRHGIEVRDMRGSIYLGRERTGWYKRPEDDEGGEDDEAV